MEFLIVFIATAAVVLALRGAIKKAPVLFYAAAAVAVILLFAGINSVLPGTWWKPLILLVQRCMVALSLFTIVMFIGVLPKGSKLDMWLRPIRAELSIIACILCLGHMCMYLVPYATRALSGIMGASMLASFVVAIVLFALLLVLGITSFSFVKLHMHARTWKNVQKLAYPFFILAYVHLMFMLAPAASKGGEQAIFSVALYSVAFVLYIVLRLVRASKEKQTEHDFANHPGAVS